MNPQARRPRRARSSGVLGTPLRRLAAIAAAFVSAYGAFAIAGTSMGAMAHPLARTSASGAGCNQAALSAALSLPGMTVTGAVENTTGSAPNPPGPALTGLPNYCQVTLTQLDSSGNPISIWLWLPDNWNGRFQGVGGAVFECGPEFASLAQGIAAGYATATTDCGVPPADLLTGLPWALSGAGGTYNTALIDDFAYNGIHQMTVDGQALTKAYYGAAAAFSYWNGCSTGGREGLMEAQMFPSDYNGILVGAPAINWTKFIPSELWPEIVMSQSNDFLPSCKEQAFTDAVIEACGGIDGVIQDPGDCNWNPMDLVGLVTPCGVITATDAQVVEKIWQGPNVNGQQLWYGLEPGTSFSGLAGTSTTGSVTTGVGFPIATAWLGNWVPQNATQNPFAPWWTSMTYSQFAMLFADSVSNSTINVLATDNPNLSQFEKDGGKLIVWHGLADQLIFPQGTINYYNRVQATMGVWNTDSFARLFLAPGAAHCGAANGPAPGVSYSYPDVASPLPDLVNWVEHGVAPLSIEAIKQDATTNVITESRPLCAYPLQAAYNGFGNPNEASSYHCTGFVPFAGARYGMRRHDARREAARRT